jgi:hypothetical protein
LLSKEIWKKIQPEWTRRVVNAFIEKTTITMKKGKCEQIENENSRFFVTKRFKSSKKRCLSLGHELPPCLAWEAVEFCWCLSSFLLGQDLLPWR